MKFRLLSPENNSIINYLKQSLTWAKSLNLAVSYASYYGFQKVQHDIIEFLRRNGKLRSVFDIEKYITDGRIIEEFSTIPGDSECKVFIKPHSTKSKCNYHSKFYFFYNNQRFSVLIGSSNFTLGGLQNNIESDIVIEGLVTDTFFQNILQHFKEIWNNKFTFNVLSNNELIEKYNEIQSIYQKEELKKIKINKPLLDKFLQKTQELLEQNQLELNEDYAYFLGLISANSKINIENSEFEIHLDRHIFHVGKSYEGYYYVPEVSDYKINQKQAHQRDVDNLVENLRNFFISKNIAVSFTVKYLRDFHFLVILKFKDNEFIEKIISEYKIRIQRSKIIPFVPTQIENSSNKIIMAFLKGYCTLKSRISSSDGIYKTVNGEREFTSLRLGISIPHGNIKLLNQFSTLFKMIKINKGISISNPEKRISREFLIRIDARYVPPEIVGTHWKRIFLHDFRTYLQQRSKK